MYYAAQKHRTKAGSARVCQKHARCDILIYMRLTTVRNCCNSTRESGSKDMRIDCDE